MTTDRSRLWSYERIMKLDAYCEWGQGMESGEWRWYMSDYAVADMEYFLCLN